ncbi:MAG: amino acid adenylation domain-containing protein [Anaerolineae bacterium]|nr:amino acid adenylation domain-containing protein [Anaerolineae bacterium]
MTDLPKHTAPLRTNSKPVEASFPLSPMQEGMLFHSLQSREAGFYIEQIVIELMEEIDVSAFTQSWQEITSYHPVLRTGFEWAGNNQPLQLVYEPMELFLGQHDLRGLSTQEQEVRLQNYLEQDRKQGFEMDEPPLMRLVLFRIAEAHYRCVWTFHHAILDGRSFTIILRELFSIYDALCNNEKWSLAPSRPYQEFITWLQHKTLDDAEVFWKHSLEGFMNPNPLSFGFPEANGQGYGEQETRLSREITSTLENLARQHQLTLNTLLQGAWAILLSHYTGEKDIVFGTTRSGRHFPIDDAKSMVGLFINTVPLRVKMVPEKPLLDLLMAIREQSISIRPHEHTPLHKIQEWSGIPHGSALFNSLLVFENYILNTSLKSQGGKWTQREFKLLDRTNYPLTLAAFADSELLLSIEYDLSRFDNATMIRLLGHLKGLLTTIAAAGLEKNLIDLPLLTPQERNQLLVEWNNTRSEIPLQKCIHELFEAQVRQSPDAIAVVFEDKQLTYHELNCQANQLANYLISLGVKPETLVGICIDRSLEMIIGLIGILKAGGAYVPLDPTYPKERLAFMLADAQVPMLLTQQYLLGDLPKHAAHTICLNTNWQLISQESEINPVSGVTVDNLAYVIYTSGSTGKPKGVMVEHHSLVNYINAASDEYGMEPGDRNLQFASINFDVSAEETYTCLTRGATLILCTNDMLGTVARFLQKCREWHLTVLTLPTAYWHELTMSIAQESLHLPDTLRLVIIGGEKAMPEYIRKWRRSVGRQVRLLNAYGPTEGTISATICDLSKPIHSNGSMETSIGRPIRNVQTYVLDTNLQPVPIGAPGELHLGGVGLARGYLNAPKLTSEKFISNPFSDIPESRLYKTGDLVRYMPDGNIEFLGRVDHQVKIRGFRVELGEIETVLAQHPAIREVAAIVREDVPGDKRLVAYVVCTNPDLCKSADLREFLQERLPAHMIPSNFVFLNAIPLTPSGKINRNALPPPDQEQREEQVNARDITEEKLVGIWESLLLAKPIGVKDDFFELGGDSLLAMRMFTWINQEFGVNLPLATLFQEATIEHLADVINRRTESVMWSSLIKIEPYGDYPPFFCIHGITGDILWFRDLARYLAPNYPFYGLQSRGLDGIQTPLTRIEEIAAHYIQEIRLLQPTGPYNLGGASFGGTVALEIAQQLLTQGEQVSMLAIFDASPPNINMNTEDGNLKRHITIGYRIMRNFPRALKHFIELGPSQMLMRIRRKLRMIRKTIEQTDSAKLGVFDAEDLIDFASELSPHRQQVITCNYQALKIYIPQPYPGRVTLFRAMSRQLFDIYDPEVGWQKLAPGRVDTYDIPGSHEGMFTKPHVYYLAEKLKGCLG